MITYKISTILSEELLARAVLTIIYLIVAIVYCSLSSIKIPKRIHFILPFINVFLFVILRPWGDWILEYFIGVNVKFSFFEQLAFISFPLLLSVSNVIEPFPVDINRSTFSKIIEFIIVWIVGIISFKYAYLSYVLWLWYLVFLLRIYFYQKKIGKKLLNLER